MWHSKLLMSPLSLLYHGNTDLLRSLHYPSLPHSYLDGGLNVGTCYCSKASTNQSSWRNQNLVLTVSTASYKNVSGGKKQFWVFFRIKVTEPFQPLFISPSNEQKGISIENTKKFVQIKMKLPKLKPELPISGSYYKNGTVTNVFNHCPSKHHPCYPEQCTWKLNRNFSLIDTYHWKYIMLSFFDVRFSTLLHLSLY